MISSGYTEEEAVQYLKEIRAYRAQSQKMSDFKPETDKKQPSHLHPIAKAIVSFFAGYFLGRILKQITKTFFFYTGIISGSIWALSYAKIIEIDYEKLNRAREVLRFILFWINSKWQRIKKHRKMLESIISVSGGFSSGFYFAMRR